MIYINNTADTPSAATLVIEIRTVLLFLIPFKYELELSRGIDFYHTACLMNSIVNLELLVLP